MNHSARHDAETPATPAIPRDTEATTGLEPVKQSVREEAMRRQRQLRHQEQVEEARRLAADVHNARANSGRS